MGRQAKKIEQHDHPTDSRSRDRAAELVARNQVANLTWIKRENLAERKFLRALVAHLSNLVVITDADVSLLKSLATVLKAARKTRERLAVDPTDAKLLQQFRQANAEVLKICRFFKYAPSSAKRQVAAVREAATIEQNETPDVLSMLRAQRTDRRA